MPSPDQVLDYWFAPGMAARWYVKDAGFDGEVRARLLPLHERATAGELEPWRAGARGCLALVILLDQVPRNLYRDDPRAFAKDAQALAITHRALERGLDRELSQIERLFLYLPLEHCESLEEQQLCCELVGALDENPEWHDHAIQHRDIIARFGRFPHRNAALGRQTTPEEAAFLIEPAPSF